MSSKTRKFIWSVPVVAVFAVIGALAAFGVLGLQNAEPVEAAAPTVEDGDEIDNQVLFIGDTFEVDLDHVFTAVVSDPTDTADDIFGYEGQSSTVATATVAVDATTNVLTVTAVALGTTTITVTASDSTPVTALTTVEEFDVAVVIGTLESSSTTGDAGIELTLTIAANTLATEAGSGAINLAAGDRIEIYLEDDYQVPDSIDPSDVYFRVPGGAIELNGGGRVRAADVSIDTDDHFTKDKDDYAISILIPDMNPATEEAGSITYPPVANDLVVVITKAAGIKNPTEARDNKSGFSVLTGDENDNRGPDFIRIVDFRTEAKIALSHSEGGRGLEVTITGTGFNNGTRAEAKVLVVEGGPALTCHEVMDHDDSESLGTVSVGSDDKFSIPFTVHQDEFDPGAVNYICARDTEAGAARPAFEVKVFNNTESLTIEPASVNSGDEVTVKPRDYSNDNEVTRIFVEDLEWTNDQIDNDDFRVDVNHDGTEYVFDMPGGVAGNVQIHVRGVENLDSQRKYITVNPSMLTVSQSEVVANETVIISGSGFFERSRIDVLDITLDGDPIDVDPAGTLVDEDGIRYIRTTSAGEFTVTVNIWADGDDDPNTDDGGSAIDPDTYEIEAEDAHGYTGSATVTILEPTVSVTPAMASPRDFITISGTNWPASVDDDDYRVCITISESDDGGYDTDEADIDSTGRFNLQVQLDNDIGIGEVHEVVVEFCGDDSLDAEATIEVPESNVVLTPTAAAPGQTITLDITGMPRYTNVRFVYINGIDRLHVAYNTDGAGNVTITDLLVPGLDAGFYPVEIHVGEEVSVVQLEVLEEAIVVGTAASVSEALSEISGSLVRVFHFNNTTKVWTFYDPRPEFEGLNTLTELADGQPYWILVSEAQENVVLNGKIRDLTCVGGDCWNQEVW